MADFLKSSSVSADMATRKEALMNSIRSEIALLNVQELMNKGTEKCFAKCVTKPGSSLSNSEQTDIWMRLPSSAEHMSIELAKNDRRHYRTILL
ncbi:hypothetical protein AX17_002001 [Amanita inopinata Kibby_2008]|nr:hypothetical protein AX17_002001 [Amanita inopinata Kibby_2008]